jgi:hypothetical protein
MDDMILNVNTFPEPLYRRFRSNRVRVHEEENGVVTLTPIQEPRKDARTVMTPQQQELWEEVKSLYGIIRSDIDEKAELAEARDEKYARFG